MTDFNRIELNIPRTVLSLAVPEVSERLLKRPLMVPAFVLFASCYLTYLSENKTPMLLLAVLLTGIALCSVKMHDLTLLFCSLISILLVITCCLRIISALGAEYPESIEYAYSGTVLSCERKLSGTNRITVEIQGVRADLRFGKEIEVPELSAGETFKVTGRFREPEKAGNPGEFDYSVYLKSKGIRYMFYADSFASVSKPKGIVKMVLSFPERCFKVREYLFERFTYGRSVEEKALLAAVCLGDSSLDEDKVTRDFKLSGCSHLLAVSGTHFAGFLAVLPYILSAISQDRKKTTVVYAFFAFLIACMTGWSESVTRSAFMSSTAFAGKDTVSAMSAAALVMIVADPFCSCRTGFLLSFSACIAIRLLSGRIADKLGFLKDKKGIKTALSAQTAAILGTMPFTGLLNSRFGIVQFIVQAIGGILAKGVCLLFVPGVLLSLMFPKECGYVFSAPSCLFLGFLRKITGIGSSMTLLTAGGKPIEPFFILSIWLVIVLKLLPGFALRKMLIKLSCVLVSISFGLAVSGFVKPIRAEVIFADVGQGDCCLIIAGNTTCLIDSGTFEKGEKNVAELLDYYGISHVDIALMTHWDQDHAGGIAALNKEGRIGRIYTGFTGIDSDTEAFDKSLLSRHCDPKEFRLNLEHVKAGDVFELSDDVRIRVIYPENCNTGGNPGSLVALLECKGISMLFTGDIASDTEETLVSQGLITDVELLKVSHHGSKYSSSSSFLKAANPEISVIQVGKNNLYGHPSPKAVERIEKVGSSIYRTDNDGAVIFEFY